MRPLKLELNCFGTYYKNTVIDLEKLGNNGLYLITGDTGSGKTTIFDAISYALFDEASGANRDGSMFRSTLATLDDDTYVVLEFEHLHKKYVLKRSPSYERNAKKGSGTTIATPTASLVSDGMEPVIGSTKVNEYIRTLLCLDKSQFSQIAMIAQGDFQKILFLETKDRIPVFRKLFKTEKYEALEKRLNEQSSELDKVIAALKNELKVHINSIRCPSDNVLSIQVEKAKENKMPTIAEVIDLLTTLISEEENEAKKLQICEKENDKKITDNTAKLTALLEKENQISEINLKEKELESAKTENAEAKKEFAFEKDRQTEKKDKENTLAVLKEKMSQYDNLEEKQNFLNEKQLTYSGKTKELETACKKVEELAACIENLKQEQQKYDDSETKLLQSKNEIEIKDKVISQINDFCKKTDKYFFTKEKYENAKFDLQNAIKAETEMTSIEAELRSSFLKNQAGIMAEELVEGTPCPVCGSIHHESKAHKSPDAPTQTMVEAAEDEARIAKERSTECSTIAAGLKSDVENQLKNLKDDYEALQIEEKSECKEEQLKEICEDLKKQCVTVSESCDVLKNLVIQLEKQVQRKNELKTEIPVKESELLKITDYKNQLTQETGVLQEQIKNISENIKEISSSLEYETKQLALAKMDLLSKEIETIAKAYEIADEKVKTTASNIDKLEGQISSLNEQVKGFSVEEKNNLIKEKEELLATKNRLDEKINSNLLNLETNKTALSYITDKSSQINKEEEKFKWLNSLARTANGTIGAGKSRIQLETFVQMTFLDKVIALANKRLAIMSDGQYDLIRKTEGDKQSQSGLDINVIDHYNGGERSVKSLSGGESFEASLALALGLSDVIANYAGGIKIDTMFIDEGFGTLDTDTLQKAFKALSSISEGNNKLIGIISHVDLLKEKVNKQIKVTKKSGEGSSVQIIL